MTNEEHALRLFDNGVRVFPVHTMRSGNCSCRNGAACNPKNRAKHPMTPNGVNCVNDPDYGIEKVKRWWGMAPDANIGVALGNSGGGLYAQDIDNSSIAQRLLQLLTSRTVEGVVVVVSGREGGGCHIYLRSDVDEGPQNLVTTDGEKIGELRGTGAYVIAPPSLHALGRHYTYVVGDLGLTAIRHVEDPRAAIVKLLSHVGVAVAPPKARVVIEIDGVQQIQSIECPFDKTNNSKLLRILSGSMPTSDKSQTLLDLGKLLWSEAEAAHYPITETEVAGVIKAVDAVMYRKYADRRSADWFYWKKAVETKQYVKQG
jgi:hypothetical protein